MEDKILDNADLNLKKTSIQFVGIGIFLILTILGFSVFFKNVFHEIFTTLDVKPLYNLLLTQVICCAISFLLFLLFLKKIKKVLQNGKGENLIFITTIVGYAISQVLVFLNSFIFNSFLPQSYLHNLEKYQSFFNKNLLVGFIPSGFEIVELILFIFIINRASKAQA